VTVNRISAGFGAVVGAMVWVTAASGGAAWADADVSIRPAVGSGTLRPEAEADFSRVLLTADDGRREWRRIEQEDGSTIFVHRGTRRCLDLSDPDDAGSAVVIRDCAAGSLSQRWERHGLALVDRDTKECLTAVRRASEDMLAAADCVAGDATQEWVLSG
jgi:hypothetical protein